MPGPTTRKSDGDLRPADQEVMTNIQFPDFVLLRPETRQRIQTDENLRKLLGEALIGQSGLLHYADAYLCAYTNAEETAHDGLSAEQEQLRTLLDEYYRIARIPPITNAQKNMWCVLRALKISFREIQVNREWRGCIVEWSNLPSAFSLPVICTFQHAVTKERTLCSLGVDAIIAADPMSPIPQVRLEERSDDRI